MAAGPGHESELDKRGPHTWATSPRFIPTTFVQPVLRFSRQESAGGIVLLAAALVAIIWANSRWSAAYFELFDTVVEITFGGYHFHHLSELTVREWINDAAMVLFFFVVGLEIKRELVVGELRDPKAAALPVVAALGGMVVPAAIYLLWNLVLLPGQGAEPGAWGVPMATDIAFAVGVVALLGHRVPVSAKLFLLALAIVDDLGAIIVIALVYTEEVSLGWLATAAGGLLLIALMNRVDVRATGAYMLVGAFAWLSMLESGVHATLAGVAVAFLVPVSSFYDPREFDDYAQPIIDKVKAYLPDEGPLHQADHHTIERVTALVTDLRVLSYETVPPLSRLEFKLAPISAFLVVPGFALANAGVTISSEAIAGAAGDPVLLGVLVGLLVGKTIGVAGFAWLAIRAGIARMPYHTTWRHVFGLSMLAGIGFTVALFVASLSLTGPALDSAKLGIFAASLLAGTGGYLFLRRGAEVPQTRPDHAAIGADTRTDVTA